MRRVDTGSPVLNLVAAIWRQAIKDANDGDGEAWTFLQETADDLVDRFAAVKNPPSVQLELFNTFFGNYENGGQYGPA